MSFHVINDSQVVDVTLLAFPHCGFNRNEGLVTLFIDVEKYLHNAF